MCFCEIDKGAYWIVIENNNIFLCWYLFLFFPDSMSYPLRIEVNGLAGWSTCGTHRENFIDEFNTTCTVAVASTVLPSPTLSFTLHVDTSHIALTLRRIQVRWHTNKLRIVACIYLHTNKFRCIYLF